MKKELSYDWYKIRKSKSLKLTILCTVLLSILLSLANYLIWGIGHEMTESFLKIWWAESVSELSVIIFVSFFVTKDYSGGYIKNIYKPMNKFNYIFSKFIFSFAYVLFLYIIKTLFSLLFHLLLANKVIYDPKVDGFTISEIIANKLIYIGLLTALSSLIIFVSTIVKKDAIVAVFFLAYFIFLSTAFYAIINFLIKTGVDFGYYTVVGNLYGLHNYIGKVEGSVRAVICIVSYSTLSILGSWFVVSKRSY